MTMTRILKMNVTEMMMIGDNDFPGAGRRPGGGFWGEVDGIVSLLLREKGDQNEDDDDDANGGNAKRPSTPKSQL